MLDVAAVILEGLKSDCEDSDNSNFIFLCIINERYCGFSLQMLKLDCTINSVL